MYIAISSLLSDEMNRSWKFMREGRNYVGTHIFFLCLFYTHTPLPKFIQPLAEVRIKYLTLKSMACIMWKIKRKAWKIGRNNQISSDITFILKAAFYCSFLASTTKLLLSFSLFYLPLCKGIFRCIHSPSLWFQKRISTQDEFHLYFLFSSFVLLKDFSEVTQ